MDDSNRRDWAVYLIDEAVSLRSEGDLPASMDLSAVALDAVRDDRSTVGVEIFVRGAAVRARSLRNRDQSFEAYQLTGEGLSAAKVFLPAEHRTRLLAEASHLASLLANFERDDSHDGLIGALRHAWAMRAAWGEVAVDGADIELALESAQIARRVGHKEASATALERAQECLLHVVEPDLTARYYLARSLHELVWGNESEGVECLELSDRVSAGTRAREVHNRFGHASAELRFGSPGAGTERLRDACRFAEDLGFFRPARVGRKDLEPLLRR